MSANGLDGRKGNPGNTEVLLRHRHQWPKGVSGNPSGRTRDNIDIADLCRRHGEKAYETIVALMDDPNPRIRLAACQEILSRAFGKPIAQTAPNNAAHAHLLEALQELARAPTHPIVDITPLNEKLRISEKLHQQDKAMEPE